MKQDNAPDVLITEVGPRDGLQSIDRVMPTQAKHQWIHALAKAGLREIEVGSYVPAKLLPQMADVDSVVKEALSILGLAVTVLVPNLKGAQAAFASGAHKITIPFSVSEAHSISNVRKTHPEMMKEVKAIVDLRNEHYPDVTIETSLSTAFGCSIAGPVSEELVQTIARQVSSLGVDEIGLADTTGYANPAQIKRLFTRVRGEVGDRCANAHLHNTRGLGLANALAAYETGIRLFDSSMGGIGGCPFAPGASGNVVTEDLVFMFESMGVSTGIDLEKLFHAREVFLQGMPDEPMYGMIAGAGLPKGFHIAGARA